MQFLFRTGRTPVEVNVADIGVARDFHGDPTTSDLETQVSALESSYALLLERLVSARGVSNADRRMVAEFVTHLLVRSRHAREGVVDVFNSLLHSFGHVLEGLTPDQVRAELQKAMDEVVKKAEFQQVLVGLTNAQRKAVVEWILERVDYEWAKGLVVNEYRLLRSAVDVPSIMTEAHRSSLAKHLGKLSEPSEFRRC